MGTNNAVDFERLEALIQGQGDILELISQNTTLKEVFEAIVLWVEKQSTEGLRASLLYVDDAGKQLLHGAAPSLPTAYNQQVHGLSIAYGEGSCGTAAYTKEDVITDDIANDPLWKDYKEVAKEFGLAACWSTPLVSKNGKVLGTFAMYYNKPQKPTPFDLQILRLVNRTAVIAIEHKLALEEQTRLKEIEDDANERVRNERQQLRSFFMQAPALIAILAGPEHVYELVNPMYQAVVGPSRTFVGNPIRKALPELENQGIFDLLDEVYRTGTPYEDNELLLKIDRKETGELEDVYFNFVFQPRRNASGETEGIFVHAVDITELVLAKKRAENSEGLFKSFVLNSPMPIGIYIGREMRIQTANDAILAAWDKKRDQVMGKTFREALPELEGQPFYQLLDDVYTTGIPYHATEDQVVLIRNGKLTTTYYNFSYTPLRDEKGQIYGVMNTAAEVTDLVVAKQNLATVEENLRTAIDLAELGTWQLNIATNTLRYGPRMEAWHGLPPKTAQLPLLLQSIHVQDSEKVAWAIDKAINHNTTYDVEYRVTNPNTGEAMVLHTQGKVFFDKQGKPEYLNGTAKDLTLRRLTEKRMTELVDIRTAELKQANIELQNLNENLQQFVYIASHDLQEPLRKIIIFSDMLLSKHYEQLEEGAQKYLNKITEASKRMADLIKDLLDFSRLGSNDKHYVQTDLNEIMHNLEKDYELLIQQKGATLHYEALCTIEAVPLQMNQLFYNLIGNALKFSKPNVPPKITITSRLLNNEEASTYKNFTPKNTYCEIVVSDDGIGFEQHLVEQIFVIFKRLHTQQEYEGTGIGLALCKKIVDNHQGIIFAKSEVNAGASFHVILPVKRQLI